MRRETPGNRTADWEQPAATSDADLVKDEPPGDTASASRIGSCSGREAKPLGPLRLFEALATATVFTFFVRHFALRIADTDVWGRLAVGKLFFAHGSMPTTDPFAFTPTLPVWVDHEWLTGVVFYLVYSASGLAGIWLFKTLLGLATVGLVLWSIRHWNRLPTLLLLAVTMPVIGYGLLPRAQLFTFFFFALWLTTLDTYIQCGSARGLLILPATIIPWANLHGGFLAGLGLLSLYAVAFRSRTLGLLFLACGILSWVTPYGLDYWWFLARAVPMNRPGIEEWAAVPLTLPYANFWLLFLAACYGLTRLDLRRGVILGLLMILAMRHARHMPLFAIVACVYLPPILFAKRQPVARHPGWMLPLACSCACVYQVVGFVKDGPFTLVVPDRVQGIDNMVVFPVHTVAYAAEQRLEGNLVVPFNWGEYAIWMLPGCKVSMDGRYETVYPDSTVKLVEDFFAGRSRELLTDADHVLAPVDSPANDLLAEEAGWRKVASDNVSILWTRR